MPAQGFPDYSIGFVGSIAVPNGGTGLATVDSNALLLGNGLGPLLLLDPGTLGQVLQMSGSPVAPKWGSPPAAPPTGAASGDLRSNYPAPTVVATHLSSPLPVLQGGSGTTTPALVAGANIGITGSWPNQTIALSATPLITVLTVTPTTDFTGIDLRGNSTTPIRPALTLTDTVGFFQRGFIGLAEANNSWITGDLTGDICMSANTGYLRLGTSHSEALSIDQSQIVTLAHPLAVASGGSGSSSPALAAGNGISLSGSWPNQTITNSDDAYFAAGILAIAHGGSGASSPALVAGANIGITGSWPNQTIALTATPSITTLDVTPSTQSLGVTLHGSSSSPIGPAVRFYDDTGANLRGHLGLAESVDYFLAGAQVGDICLRADTGSLLLGTSTVLALSINQSQKLTIAKALASYNGQSLVGQGVPPIIVTGSATGQTTPQTAVNFQRTSAGVFRISVYLELTAGTSVSIISYANFTSQASGNSAQGKIIDTGVVSASNYAWGHATIWAHANDAITVTFSISGTLTYAYYVVVEQLV